MTDVYRRIREKKMELGYEWDALAAAAGIHVSSWMTGLPSSNPTDEELKKLAPVLGTTFEWLKYGID